jgi:hypothetical protein
LAEAIVRLTAFIAFQNISNKFNAAGRSASFCAVIINAVKRGAAWIKKQNRRRGETLPVDRPELKDILGGEEAHRIVPNGSAKQ